MPSVISFVNVLLLKIDYSPIQYITTTVSPPSTSPSPSPPPFSRSTPLPFLFQKRTDLQNMTREMAKQSTMIQDENPHIEVGQGSPIGGRVSRAGKKRYACSHC